MKLIYPAIFTPCLEKEGYTVTIPDLPGCVTEGDSLLHAIEMGIDAASGWILGELEEGNDIPQPTPREHILTDYHCFINDLVLDIDAYAEKYGEKSVRKNITIPAWLNTYGEKNHINFSKVLQDALLKRHRTDNLLSPDISGLMLFHYLVISSFPIFLLTTRFPS